MEKKSAENSISKKGKGAMEGGVGAIGSEGVRAKRGSRSWGEKAMGARQRKKQNTSKMKRMKEQSLAARAKKKKKKKKKNWFPAPLRFRA